MLDLDFRAIRPDTKYAITDWLRQHDITLDSPDMEAL